MGRMITALTAQKRDRNRINVFLDGDFAFGLSRLVAAWLHVGQELSDEKIADLQSADSLEVAYQKVIRYLSYSRRSTQEVQHYLEKQGASAEIVDEIIKRLRRNGLIDDKRLARDWVDSRSESRPRGRRALVYEMKHKGIPDQAIHLALSEWNEDEMAYQAAKKHARKIKNLDWIEFRQKMYAHLARRGFNYETAAPVVSRIWQEISENRDMDNIDSSQEVDQ
jgi:regulatory protein